MRVVILTASAMTKEIDGTEYSGKCITALSLESNRILRFVKNQEGAPIGNPYCNRFHPLDVFEIAILKACPMLCQTENVLVDYYKAEYVGQYGGTIEDLFNRFQNAVSERNSFLWDSFHKLDDVSDYHHSLEMIRVDNLVIVGNKCEFYYRRRQYKYFSLTDTRYKQDPGEQRQIGSAILAVSIPTNDYRGSYYKFVASIYPI